MKYNGQTKKTLAGMIGCLLVAVLGMAFYLVVQRHTSVIDVSNIPVVRSDEQTYCLIEHTGVDEHGTIYITAMAQSGQMQYSYHNWVLGEGTGIYDNISLLLVNTKTNKAYRLKTYSHSMLSASEREDTLSSGGQELTAYGRKEMLQEKSMVIAAVFIDRNGKKSILYPEENQIDESKIS